MSLEDAFWNGLREIAGARNMTLSGLVETIDKERRHANLSSAIRVFVLDFYRDQAAIRMAPSITGSKSRGAVGSLNPER